MRAGGCGWIGVGFWFTRKRSTGQLDWPVTGVDLGWRSGISKSEVVMFGSCEDPDPRKRDITSLVHLTPSLFWFQKIFVVQPGGFPDSVVQVTRPVILNE